LRVRVRVRVRVRMRRTFGMRVMGCRVVFMVFIAVRVMMVMMTAPTAVMRRLGARLDS
jgi:hypothetical protein